MNNSVLVFVICFLGLILQTTLLPMVTTSIGQTLHLGSLTHLTINLTYLVLIYLFFSREFFAAFFWLIVIVLLQNAFDYPWRGSLALSYLFILILISAIETVFVFQYSLTSMALIFFLVILQNVFLLLLGRASLGFEQPFRGEVLRLFVSSFFHTLIAPFLFYVLYWIDSRTIFHFDKSKSFFGKHTGL